MSVEPTTKPGYEVLIPTYPQVERRASITRHWMTSTASWIAMAAGIIAVASITSLLQVTAERDKLATQAQNATDRAVGTTYVDSLQGVIAQKERMIANLIGPQVAVVSLASASAPSPNGRMFWDQSANQWTFIAHNLPRPRAGRAYQLWLVTPSQKISAGMFTPQPNGDVMMQMRYSLPKDALTAVAVTEEPAEGSAQPTSTPYIAGQRLSAK